MNNLEFFQPNLRRSSGSPLDMEWRFYVFALLEKIAYLYTSAFKFVFMDDYLISKKILHIPILVCMYVLAVLCTVFTK